MRREFKSDIIYETIYHLQLEESMFLGSNLHFGTRAVPAKRDEIHMPLCSLNETDMIRLLQTFAV
jgi:hypothetical protein